MAKEVSKRIEDYLEKKKTSKDILSSGKLSKLIDNIDRSINIINFIDFYRQDKIINYDQCTLTTSFKLVCSELTINLYSSFILIDNKVKIIINGETYPKEIPKEISHNIIIKNILMYIVLLR